MFKCIITGSRGFNDYSLMKRKLDNIFFDIEDDIEIVSGGAIGADSLGEKYGHENGLLIKRILPDWEKFGNSAGYKRNEEMAKYVSPDGGCVVF